MHRASGERGEGERVGGARRANGIARRQSRVGGDVVTLLVVTSRVCESGERGRRACRGGTWVTGGQEEGETGSRGWVGALGRSRTSRVAAPCGGDGWARRVEAESMRGVGERGARRGGRARARAARVGRETESATCRKCLFSV